MTNTYDFGMIGLGVMGRNFLLNIADHGFSVAGLDTDATKAAALETEAAGKPAKGTTSTQEFVASLKRPRHIMLLVPAGKPVDSVIESLLPFVEKDDLIIDGGNSFFEDTERRFSYLKEKNIHFMGMGVSGGSKGARFGPSIMPGGAKEAYEPVRPILEAVSAKVNGDPCVAFLGNGSSGHYVKMVHNGIEYGMMQLIAEAYDLLKNLGGLSNKELHETFDKWNNGRLRSYLIEITAQVFAQKDDLGDGLLVDKILDKAKQKGTGKWTSQNAMDMGIPVPAIDAAVTMRGLSALKLERLEMEAQFPKKKKTKKGKNEKLVKRVEAALYFAFTTTYAQGLHLLAEASEEKNYGLDLETIARIWRGGCIIRADLLELIRQAYSQQPGLKNLLLSPVFKDEISKSEKDMRKVLRTAIKAGVPVMAMAATLTYFDAFRSGQLPLNLVQAQRDLFGSHTYERVDKAGVFHTEW
ncbi:MAG: NADP-dependent phosphogluconate dehydrogenase [Lewinellaceae bacterium]|nr:NADP-dependent phosphogluconate dehydrogenase [Saprospiraceae bacterium]MCB9339550.1 NADP-dependent phosphogluconate dehydrogenase [Lewinellaceae bacterium]